MHVFATFEHSLYLELAITELEQKGFKKENIFAIGMEQRKSKRKIIDNIHYSDGISIVDGATVLGSLLMVMGGIYGFLLEWGPIIWGLIGLSVGIVVGGILDLLIRQNKQEKGIRKNGLKGIPSEVIMIVKCSEEHANLVEEILQDHFAVGTARYDKQN